jgi:hypothetical protein
VEAIILVITGRKFDCQVGKSAGGLAVTPVAAYVPQPFPFPFTYVGGVATTLHTQEADLAKPPLAGSHPTADSCLLCYSPSHNLLTRLSG